MVPTDSSTVFTSVYDQMSQEPPLLTITFFFATCIKYPRTLAVLDVQTVANRCGIHSECFSHSDRSLHKHWPIHLSLAYFVPKSSNIVWKKARLLYSSQKLNHMECIRLENVTMDYRGGPHMRSVISIDFPAPEMEPESAHVVSAVSVP